MCVPEREPALLSSADRAARAGTWSDLGDGIRQLRLPMTGNPIGYINAYLLEDDDGYTLVDCGWKADDVLAALQAGLAHFDVPFASIRRLLITHFHYDHYGLAATLQREGLPELIMHAKDWAIAQRMFADPVGMDAASDAWIALNGYAVESDPAGDAVYHTHNERAEPTRLLEDGERVGRLVAVHTPGHTPGHLCFVDERSRRLLSGDHILDPVTPHVGIWQQRPGDPIGDFIASLHRCANIGASEVLPAHGEPFPDLKRRTTELLGHVAQRESQVLRILANGSGSGADVARDLPWTRREQSFEDLSGMHQQFAVAETLAHLKHLQMAGGVVSRIFDDQIIYERTRLLE